MWERAIRWALWVCASLALVAVWGIVVFLAKEGLPVVGRVGLGNLLGTEWVPTSPQEPRFGIWPWVVGSVLVTGLALGLALPFGVGGAVYVAEFAGPRERTWLKPFVEVLAGVPSVVLGWLGLVMVAPVVRELFGLSSGLTALTGAILLAFMAVPTILSVGDDALRAVPRSFREASLALGATRWQTTWRVTLPAARSGVLAAVLLGMGRVVGETMTVMMVTGNAAVLTLDPTNSVRTMTATIAAEMGEAGVGSAHRQSLFLVGLLLLVMTWGVNVLARRVVGGGTLPGAGR